MLASERNCSYEGLSMLKKKKSIGLGTLEECPLSTEKGYKEQEGRTPMRYDNTVAVSVAAAPAEETDASKRRDYLRRRLSDVMAEKKNELRKFFYMDGDALPRSFEELLARLLAGKFVIDEKHAKQRWSYNFGLDHVQWRDPSKQADEDGYEKAKTAMMAAAEDAKDQICIIDPEKGLEVLNAFKAASFV